MKETMALIDLEQVFWQEWHKTGARGAHIECVKTARRLAREHTYVGLAFDGIGSWRTKLDADWKVRRRQSRQEGLVQIARTREVLEVEEGFHVLHLDGYDAIDMILSAIEKVSSEYSRLDRLQSAPIITVYGSSLLYLGMARELPLPRVVVVQKRELWTQERVQTRFDGLSGESVVRQIVALGGDGSNDHLGIPGVGEKRAVTTLKQKSLFELMATLAQGLGAGLGNGLDGLVERAFRSKALNQTFELAFVNGRAPVHISELLTAYQKPSRKEAAPPSSAPPPSAPPTSAELLRNRVLPDEIDEDPIEEAPTEPPPPPTPTQPSLATPPRTPPPQRTPPTNGKPLVKGKFIIETARRAASPARIALCGPAGSGKTYTALQLAKGLTDRHERIVLIDTENRSAAKYADGFWQQLILSSFTIQDHIEAIEFAQQHADVLIIDSISHAWAGPGGALEMVENRQKSLKNKMEAWRFVTPVHNRLVAAMVNCKCHLIVTMRTKTEWVFEQDDRGRQIPRKLGTKPIQRDGMEYEFDIVCDLTWDHDLLVSKTRLPSLDGKVISKPGAALGAEIRGWLS